MAAECDIQVGDRACGVLAVGRCSTCGDAFCRSHQASRPEYGGDVFLTDQCIACRANQVEAERQQVADRQAAAEKARRDARDEVTEALAELRRAGSPGALPVYTATAKVGTFSNRVRKRYSATGQVAWYVGKFTCQYHGGHAKDEGRPSTVEQGTFVCADGLIARCVTAPNGLELDLPKGKLLASDGDFRQIARSLRAHLAAEEPR